MIFKSHVFDEPLLEFGDGGQHCDPRQGLRGFGPLQPRSGGKSGLRFMSCLFSLSIPRAVSARNSVKPVAVSSVPIMPTRTTSIAGPLCHRRTVLSRIDTVERSVGVK